MSVRIDLESLRKERRWALALDKKPHTALNGAPKLIGVNAPESFVPYETAAAWAKRHKGHVGLLLGGELDGTGLVLCGIDIDWKHSSRPGKVLPPEVEATFVAWLRATYWEWSVSQKGLHALGLVRRELAKGAHKLQLADDIELELYAYPEAGKRMFVCTWDRLPEAPETLSDISVLAEELLPKPAQKPKRGESAHELIAAVRTATEGHRHNTLIQVAGKLAARGQLTAHSDQLREAALDSGLPPSEVERALKDAQEWETKANEGIQRSGLAEALLAERLHKYIGGAALYAELRGAYVWDGARWMRDTELIDLTEAYLQMIGDLIAAWAHTAPPDTLKALIARRTTAWSKRVIETMLADPMTRKVYGSEHFDAHAGILNTPRGIVDLATGKLMPHDPDLLCTKLTGAPYEPNLLTQRAPTWERFLNDIFCGDTELIAWVQKAVGASAWGDPREHVLFILWGTGANGKSTFLEVLRHVLGDYAGSVSVEAILGDKNALSERLNAQLYGLRFAFASETREDAPLNESRIKALTGGDQLYARFLYKEGFRFAPTHMLWLATNHKPRIKATDYGTWRRIRLIPFTAQFRGDKANPRLKQELLKDAPAILAWIVEGAMRWHREGLGEPPAAIATATETYQRESDPLAEWLAECTEDDPKALTQAGELYENYRRWAESTGDPPLGAHAWGRRMTEKGYEKVGGSGGKKYRKGLRIKQLDP